MGQSVEGADFTGERAEGCGLHVFLVGFALQLAVILAKGFLLEAHLIEAGGLEEHAGVGAGQTGDGESTDHGGSHEDAGIVKGNGDLTERPILLTCNENDVVTRAQFYVPEVSRKNPSYGRSESKEENQLLFLFGLKITAGWCGVNLPFGGPGTQVIRVE